ncbi:MAG: hypothetical protein PHV24_04825 [Candidatus Kapabacteria bacterium]|nr:hypothetical protein [Candidatus Kapabacteria bacterium]
MLKLVFITLLVLSMISCAQDPLQVKDLHQNRITLNNDTVAYFLVFSDEYVICSDCYKELETVKNDIKTKSNVVSGFIMKINSRLEAKNIVLNIRPFMKTDSIFLDYFENEKPKLWTKFGVKITPSVLMVKGNRYKYLDYNELFNSNINLESTVKEFYNG